MIETHKVNLEHINSITVDCEAKARLVENGYPVDELEAWTAKSHDSEEGHFVVKYESLKKPLAKADAVEDKCFAYLCTCSDFLFRRLENLEDAGVNPVSVSPCKHIKSVDKTLRAKHDEEQETL